MTRFIKAESRVQAALFPEHIEDPTDEQYPVWAVEAFVDLLDFQEI